MRTYRSWPEYEECPRCEGRGWVDEVTRVVSDDPDVDRAVCHDCDGTGFVKYEPDDMSIAHAAREERDLHGR
jgi:DnaJ-class molecular chaperone